MCAKIADGKSPPRTLNCPGGAAEYVGSLIPGALSILKGAVPDRARGLGHMAPTYFRREPGIATPTAIAAPHSFARVLGQTTVGRREDRLAQSVEQRLRHGIVLGLRRAVEAEIVPRAHPAEHPC